MLCCSDAVIVFDVFPILAFVCYSVSFLVIFGCANPFLFQSVLKKYVKVSSPTIQSHFDLSVESNVLMLLQ